MLSTHTGGNVYCGDADYDAYTGRIISEYTVTKRLRNGYLLRKHVQVIDVGRSARVEPVDPDDDLAREKLPRLEMSNHTRHLLNGAEEYQERIRADRHAALVALIQERGPITNVKAAAILNCTPKTLQDTITVLPGVVNIGRTYPGGLWLGFPGQTPQPPPVKMSPITQRVYDCLLTHGPLRIYAIIERTGIAYGSAKTVIMRNRDIFFEAAVGQSGKFKKAYGIFGLVGIHDVEVQP